MEILWRNLDMVLVSKKSSQSTRKSAFNKLNAIGDISTSFLSPSATTRSGKKDSAADQNWKIIFWWQEWVVQDEQGRPSLQCGDETVHLQRSVGFVAVRLGQSPENLPEGEQE